MSREQFIQSLLPGALEAARRTGLDPRLIIAQAAQETGWGRSAPGNNYFGIKSHGKGGGQTFTTHEVINGKRVKIKDSFRRYNSPSESALGYAEFLQTNPRYRNMLSADGLDAQLDALGRSGYATDPNYARSVGAIARGIDLQGAKYIPGQAAAQPAAAPQVAGTPAPPLPEPKAINDMPIMGGVPMGQPPAAMAQAPAQAPIGISPMLTQMMGAMSMQPEPQFSPAPPIQGPSPQQATALTDFIKALRNRALA